MSSKLMPCERLAFLGGGETLPRADVKNNTYPTEKDQQSDGRSTHFTEELQAIYIDTYIKKTKSLNKYDGVLIGGQGLSNHKIIRAINGELKNTHNSVFKNCLGKKYCEECEEISDVFNRAHTISRLTMAEKVLNKIHPDLTVPIDMKVFIVAFIEEHKYHGVWMLCKECHKK